MSPYSSTPLPLTAPSKASNPHEDGAAILHLARQLARLAGSGDQAQPLKGFNLAFVCESGDAADNLFCMAARALGARVSLIPPSLTASSASADVQHTARVLGRLYAAVEWPGIPPALLEQLKREASIAVFGGISLRTHPLARLIDYLDIEATEDVKWRLLIQAALIHALR